MEEKLEKKGLYWGLAKHLARVSQPLNHKPSQPSQPSHSSKTHFFNRFIIQIASFDPENTPVRQTSCFNPPIKYINPPSERKTFPLRPTNRNRSKSGHICSWYWRRSALRRYLEANGNLHTDQRGKCVKSPRCLWCMCRTRNQTSELHSCIYSWCT